MRKASSTQASAMPRVERVTVPDSSEIGSARLKAKITSTMPISMVVGMLIIGSTSRSTSSLCNDAVEDTTAWQSP